MQDITLAEMIAAITDTDLRDWWTAPKPELSNMTMAEFLQKTLHACSLAAAAKNETLESGQKILGYPPAVNSTVEISKNKELFFKRTATLTSYVAVNLDESFPVVG